MSAAAKHPNRQSFFIAEAYHVPKQDRIKGLSSEAEQRYARRSKRENMHMKTTIGLFVLLAGAFAQTPPAATPAAPAAAKPAREPGLYATFNTSMGVIVVKLFEKEAPITVKNFVALTRGTKAWKDPKTGQMVTRPLYAGTIFHRVIPNFMIQGGDPTGTGMGE